MKLIKIFALSVLILLFARIISAQKQISGTISGNIISASTMNPLQYINVSLLSVSDSLVITGSTTDYEGNFVINNIGEGEYFLRFTCIGYQSKNTNNYSISPMNDFFDLGQISINEAEIKLNEVTISVNKSILNNAIDRKTYNVKQDIMSKTGSASNLLQNIPSVQVDIEGNVSMRGSSDVMILINGKPSPLMGKNRSEVLQQMPASSIDKIEVITNPSAKYKPDGTAGMINIVMKNENKVGFNGSLGANIGNQNRYNSNLNFNYNPGNFNLFGRVSYRKDSRHRTFSETRVQSDLTTNRSSYYNSDYFSTAKPISYGFALGVEYKIDPFNNFGVSGNYYYRDQTKVENTNYLRRDSSHFVFSEYNRERSDYEYEYENQIEGFFQHDFAEEDHSLRVEFNASKAPEIEDNKFSNIYLTPRKSKEYDNTLIKQSDDTKNITLDYSKPLSENSAIETGYAGEFNKNDLDFLVEFFDQNLQRFSVDKKKTSHFIFNESIHALYLTYSNAFAHLSFLAGLRAEESFIKSNLISTDTVITNNYFNLYPTLHLAYKLDDFVQLQLNYSRRANRPEGDELNPFPEYRDPTNVRSGNPYLKPEFIHSIEFGLQWQNDLMTVVPSIFYRNKYNGFTSVTRAINDTLLWTTEENLAKSQSAGLELVIAASLGNFFSANLSSETYYEEIDATNLGFGANKSTVTWSGKVNCNINLLSKTMIQINAYFRSSRLTPQGKSKPSAVFNLGVRHDLFNNRLTAIFTISDLLKTKKDEKTFETPWMNQTSVYTRDSQVIYFGLTYHFGSSEKKLGGKSLQYDNN